MELSKAEIRAEIERLTNGKTVVLYPPKRIRVKKVANARIKRQAFSWTFDPIAK